jgi:hypothetical protein
MHYIMWSNKVIYNFNDKKMNEIILLINNNLLVILY